VRRRPLLALQAPQGAYLVTLHRVDTRRAVLDPADATAVKGIIISGPLQVVGSGIHKVKYIGRDRIMYNDKRCRRVAVNEA
jgi:hypothetical protein